MSTLRNDHTFDEINKLKDSYGFEDSSSNRQNISNLRRIETVDDDAMSVATNSTVGTGSRLTTLSKLNARKSNNKERMSSNLNAMIGDIVNDKQNNQDNEVFMLKEKKRMFTRINDENVKLNTLVQSLKEMKVHLVMQMEEFEVEKDKLKALNVDSTNQAIDSYLMRDCLTDLKTEGLSSDRRKSADELRDTLIRLNARCRTNQQELNKWLLDKNKQVVDHFVAGREKDMTHAIENLRNVASISPNNVQTAESVQSSSLCQSIIDAITDKAINNASKELLIEGSDVSGFTKDIHGRDVLPKDEVLSIIAQNESLKNSLSQMRKRNAQLRSKSAAAQLSEKDKERDKNGGKGISRTWSKGSISSTAGHTTSNARDTGKASSIADEDGLSLEGLASESGVPSSTVPSSLHETITFPPQLEDYVNRKLMAHCEQIVDGHPLTSMGMFPIDILHDTSAALAAHIKSLAHPVVLVYMLKEEPTFEAFERLSSSPDGSKSGFGGAAISSATLAVFEQAVSHSVQNTAVHMELSAMTTLYLTFLYSRFCNKIDGRSVQAAPAEIIAAAEQARAAADAEAEALMQAQVEAQAAPRAPSPLSVSETSQRHDGDYDHVNTDNGNGNGNSNSNSSNNDSQRPGHIADESLGTDAATGQYGLPVGEPLAGHVFSGRSLEHQNNAHNLPYASSAAVEVPYYSTGTRSQLSRFNSGAKRSEPTLPRYMMPKSSVK